MIQRIYINTDHQVTAKGLTDPAGNPVTGASVSATLYQIDGVTEIAGQTWPLTMTGDGAGNYTGELSHSIAVTDDQSVLLRVVASSEGLQSEMWRTYNVRRMGFG